MEKNVALTIVKYNKYYAIHDEEPYVKIWDETSIYVLLMYLKNRGVTIDSPVNKFFIPSVVKVSVPYDHYKLLIQLCEKCRHNGLDEDDEFLAAVERVAETAKTTEEFFQQVTELIDKFVALYTLKKL